MAGISSIATHPQRALVDAALVAGLSPHEVHAQHGEALGVSRSALYRYANSRRSPLMRQWLDASTTTAEAVSDLGAVRRNLVARFEHAGSDAAAARLSREIVAVSQAMRRDFDTDPDAEEPDAAALLHQWAQTFGAWLYGHPEHIPSVRALAAREGFDVFAADLDALAERIHKENR